MSDLRSLARALGGEITGASVVCPGPGHSQKDRSLVVTPSAAAPGGFILHSFSGDDWRDCRDHVAARLGHTRDGWKEPVYDRPIAPLKDGPTDKQRTGWALDLWKQARPIAGTSVEVYLASRSIPIDGFEDGEVLRFHPALKYGEGRIGALVALMRDIITNEPCAVHRTFLSPAGEKLDRKMLGRGAGAAVKLDVDDAVTMGITVGEGIETTLSARLMGLRPAWALCSAGGIAAFPVLPGIEAVSIIADADDTGRRAASQCARRWVDAGQEARIITPRRAGADFNDILNGVAA